MDSCNFFFCTKRNNFEITDSVESLLKFFRETGAWSMHHTGSLQFFKVPKGQTLIHWTTRLTSPSDGWSREKCLAKGHNRYTAVALPTRLEPGTSGFTVQCAIHCATKPFLIRFEFDVTLLKSVTKINGNNVSKSQNLVSQSNMHD